MTLPELIAHLRELREKAEKDCSLTLRIPTWITAGDGRDYLHAVHENLTTLLDAMEKTMGDFEQLSRTSVVLHETNGMLLDVVEPGLDRLEAQLAIAKEALELIKAKAPWCNCMDASGIARQALEKLK